MNWQNNNKKELKGQGPLLKGEEPRIGYRTRIERTTQVLLLCEKLKNVAQLNDQLSGFKEFKKRGDEFIKTGNHWEGIIKFVEDSTVSLNVVLSSKKTIECSINIPRKRR